MRHTCEHCATSYDIPDDKVAGRFLKVRCKQCAQTMHVVGVRATGSASAFWVAIDKVPLGPFSESEVKQLVGQGEINARTRMWTTGMAGWARVAESSVLGWVYGEVIRAASEHDAFESAALLSDGHGYFPDPTLSSGIMILDEKTQANLAALYHKNTHQTQQQAEDKRSMRKAVMAAAIGCAATTAGILWFVVDGWA